MEVKRLKEEKSRLKSIFEDPQDCAMYAIGSGACTLAKQIYKNEMLKKSVRFYLCDNFSIGCGNDEMLGRENAEECILKMEGDVVRNVKKAIIVSTLGGGTGTGGAPIFAKNLAEKGLEVINIVTLPFHFEGRKRLEKSQSAVCEMSKYGKFTVIINEDMYVKQFKDKTLNEFFEDIGKFIEQTILNEIHPGYAEVFDKEEAPWYRRVLGSIRTKGW